MKKILTLLIVSAMAGTMLIGCGNSQKPDSQTTEIVEESSEESVSVTEEPAIEEESTIETEPEEESEEIQQPYAVENNLVFEQGNEFIRPCRYSILEKDDSGKIIGIYEGDVVMQEKDVDEGVTKIVDISKSEVDENGNIEITVVTESVFNPVVKLKGNLNGSNFTEFHSHVFMDYYTGAVIGTTMYNSNSVSSEFNVEWEEKTYTLVVSETMENEFNWGECNMEGVYNVYNATDIYKNVSKVTVPADYDGLVFGIKKGTPEPVTQETIDRLNGDYKEISVGEKKLLDSEDGETLTADDFYLIRISDVLQ